MMCSNDNSINTLSQMTCTVSMSKNTSAWLVIIEEAWH